MNLLQNDILERVVRGDPLAVTTRELCLRIEAMLPGTTCSIVKVDRDGCLRGMVGPSLPAGYISAFDGLVVGPDVGSCGTAIHLATTVEASDIETDPRWAGFSHLPLALGLRACWSMPILGRQGEVLGAFALYYREALTLAPAEADVVQCGVHLCALAMERDQQLGELHRLAYRDMLTGLPNREAFNAVSSRTGVASKPFGALLVVDLDNLRTVNDAFGRRAGDSLLRETARRIEMVAAPFQVFRRGGDEFAVLIGVEDLATQRLSDIADQILASMTEAVDCEGRPTAPRATIGGAIAGEGATLESLRDEAEIALNHAKQFSRGGFVLYSDDIGATMSRRVSAIRDVDEALSEDRIEAHYQPVITLSTGEITGLEALFRVTTPDGKIYPAGDYFEATSDCHTATRLTRRMLDIVSRDVRSWMEQGLWSHHVGVNASSSDFHSGRLLETVFETFGKEGVPLEHLILEITESVYMGSEGQVVASAIQDLRTCGVKIALDDFGTGFASLTHLLSVPVDFLKIDKSFVGHMGPGGRGSAIVEGLLGIARKLGIEVVAEGIQEQSQVNQLRRWGCQFGQGFLYSAAVDRQTITRLLRAEAEDRAVAARPRPEGPGKASGQGGDIVRYAVLLCGSDWRVVSERRQFGRFRSQDEALHCVGSLAREAMASGATVELLQADAAGELRVSRLPDAAHRPAASLMSA